MQMLQTFEQGIGTNTVRRRTGPLVKAAGLALSGILTVSACSAPDKLAIPHHQADVAHNNDFPREVKDKHFLATVELYGNSNADNKFRSCSATRIGPTTFLFAKHCTFTNSMLDKDIMQPYDAIRAELPLPSYSVVSGDFKTGETVKPNVTSIVLNPAGPDFAIFKVDSTQNLDKIPIMPLATEQDLSALKPGDLTSVVGYPALLDGQRFPYEVEFAGRATGAMLDDHGINGPPDSEYLAFIVNNNNGSNILPQDFCQGGGMSGASFVDKDGKVVGVLSSGYTSNDPNWSALSSHFPLNGANVLCFASPVTQGLVDQYQQASGTTPVIFGRK